MSGAGAIGSDPPLDREASPESLRVRPGTREDVRPIAATVAELLVELGGAPPAATAMEATTQALLEDRDAGALLVADLCGTLVGVLAASWQLAIHAAGRYGLIQDLWVHPDWRGKAVGGALLESLYELARQLEIKRIEVGLPQRHFSSLDATEAFYRRNEFRPLGARMRRMLP